MLSVEFSLTNARGFLSQYKKGMHMTKKDPSIDPITIRLTTLEAVLKGEGSPTGCGAVIELLAEALRTNSPTIVVEDDRQGGLYKLTKEGLVKQ